MCFKASSNENSIYAIESVSVLIISVENLMRRVRYFFFKFTFFLREVDKQFVFYFNVYLGTCIKTLKAIAKNTTENLPWML